MCHQNQAFTAAEGEAAAAVAELVLPSVFLHPERTSSCDTNGVVSAWCDVHMFPDDLNCGILTAFDQYGCQCRSDPSKCPSECVGGSQLVERTHYGIVCQNLPMDSPNYVLKEYHDMHGCENNALVSAWCDDYINKHLECALYPNIDQYLCRCSGKNTNCPSECIDGSDPLVLTHERLGGGGHAGAGTGVGSVLCSKIPVDSPNYILKES